MSKINLEDFIRPEVQALKAYHVETIDCEVKLHANENSFSLSPDIREQLNQALQAVELNRYPDPDCARLKSTLSARLNVSPDHFMIGNGSDELIQILLQILCAPGDTVAFPDPTFAMYDIIGKGMGLKSAMYPLNEHWDFEAGPFLEFLEQTRPKIVLISYPNNPTGNCFSQSAIQQIIEQFSGIVVLDEAYYDFARKSFIDQLSAHNNLVVLRSLSKIGLASLRVGYGVASPALIAQVNKVRLPYNSNTLSQSFADIVLNSFDPVQQQLDTIIEERTRLANLLSEMDTLTVFPSDANFILFQVQSDSGMVFRELMKQGVLIRNLGAHPRLANCLRVTVGTHEENDRFISSLKSVFK